MLGTLMVRAQSPVAHMDDEPCLKQLGLRLGMPMSEVHALYPDLIADPEGFDPATMDSSQCELWYAVLPSLQLLPESADSIFLFITPGEDGQLMRADLHFIIYHVPEELSEGELVAMIRENGYACIDPEWARAPLLNGGRNTGHVRATYTCFGKTSIRTNKTKVTIIVGFYARN